MIISLVHKYALNDDHVLRFLVGVNHNLLKIYTGRRNVLVVENVLIYQSVKVAINVLS